MQITGLMSAVTVTPMPSMRMFSLLSGVYKNNKISTLPIQNMSRLFSDEATDQVNDDENTAEVHINTQAAGEENADWFLSDE